MPTSAKKGEKVSSAPLPPAGSQSSSSRGPAMNPSSEQATKTRLRPMSGAEQPSRCLANPFLAVAEAMGDWGHFPVPIARRRSVGETRCP